MKLNLWPLAFITYTDDMRPEFGGSARAMFIRIRPKYAADLGILKHELAHVGLFWRTCGLDFVLGRFRRYRLYDESRAYAEQMRWPDRHGQRMTLEDAAERLSRPMYRLNLTREAAISAIKRFI